ncbi:hypothetical protein ALON55S_01592 [Alishewanella longhuensis]
MVALLKATIPVSFYLVVNLFSGYALIYALGRHLLARFGTPIQPFEHNFSHELTVIYAIYGFLTRLAVRSSQPMILISYQRAEVEWITSEN